MDAETKGDSSRQQGGCGTRQHIMTSDCYYQGNTCAVQRTVDSLAAFLIVILRWPLHFIWAQWPHVNRRN
jgi:hypothetical protein